MKNKIHKIMGVGLTLVIAMALVMGFAAPVAASPGEFEGDPNEWDGFVADDGSAGDWFIQGPYDLGERIQEVRELTKAINDDLYVFVDLWGPDAVDNIFKSTDGGRTWAGTGYNELEGECDTSTFSPGTVFDMVCSSIDEDIVYATDGGYVYKTTDGGDEWDFVAKDSLETALEGLCGCCVNDWRTITSIDVTYDDNDNPFVFIGTREHDGDLGTYGDFVPDCDDNESIPGDVLYIGEAGYPANWTSLNLACFHGGNYEALAVGCAPDWADTKLTYAVVTTQNDIGVGGDHTWVVYTTGTVCGWYEFAELLYDCQPGNDFGSWAASRIGFPDDWEDTESLFVGVTGDDPCDHGPENMGDEGGDVYLAWDGYAQDMNVAGIGPGGGCEGLYPVDIISLDVMGDTDEASVIAGAFCDTSVFYSYDGGWSWDESTKDPTGDRWAYVIWYKDTALAATSGYECAVSMACVSDDVEDVGEAWNQISLIATDIDEVKYLGFSPGYVCETDTMFMVTESERERSRYYEENRSLFRYDGTYWERVYLGLYAQDVGDSWYDPDSHIDWVYVSPDFNDTNTLYVVSHKFGIWRSQDAGCSWTQLTFPCAPRTWINTAVVIDEDTVIAGGAYTPGAVGADNGEGYVFKTTRHGARPWDEYEYNATTPGDVVSFALEPGYEDPGSVLLGDDDSAVYISEDGGETWDLVGDCEAVLDPGDNTPDEDTYVIFDPAYATNNIIYAAAGHVIARCIIDPEAAWADQVWEVICSGGDDDPGIDEASGIAIADGTALYVADEDEVDLHTPVSGSYYEGGMLRSLNPDAEDAADVVFERVTEGLVIENGDGSELEGLWLTCDVSDDGCAENVLWSLDDEYEDTVWVYEDTLAQPVVLQMPLDEQKLTTTTSATLSWNELCGATCYEVSLYMYCAECPDYKYVITPSLKT